MLNGTWVACQGDVTFLFCLLYQCLINIVFWGVWGVFPSWLLQDKDIQLRTTYPGFVNAVNLYFDKLVSVVQPLMVTAFLNKFYGKE